MLTRDIELEDALLDLLDNCVDGAVRSGPRPKSPDDRPYDGYWAKISLGPDHFAIEDNCGGIPIETAKKYAFAMGRPEGADIVSPATVGMYGIGMKRSIFKLGSDALVESRNDQGFTVEFSPEWMEEDSWNDLPMYKLGDKELKNGGTRIVVYELHSDVQTAFKSHSWRDRFKTLVSRHYSIILEKGFAVSVGTAAELPNEKPLRAETFRLLKTQKVEGDAQIAPYIYIGKIGSVDVEIYAGLYRKLMSEEELATEEETRGSADDAGWTVACNDRVVVWKDKTRLTGWGEATVPNYHGQFIPITGIVLLRSDEPKDLPLTTTKRGIDAGSPVYSEIKDLMREATKNLTSFTNKWKKFPEQKEALYQSSEYVELSALREMPSTVNLTKVHRSDNMRKYVPKYPEPIQAKTSARVSFVALKVDIEKLAKHYFGEEDAKPSDVGEAAFNEAVKNLAATGKRRK